MLEIVQQQLESYLENEHPPQFLLACSGGVDSMVLLDLLHQSHCKFAVAHCNFQLRGDESDADEDLVKQQCVVRGIPFFSQRFPTQVFAKEHRLSTQMAARALRYNWFEELMEEKGFTYLITAHHLNDQVETFLINLSRASGLKGLSGIPTHRVLRPLLGVQKQNIVTYAQQQHIPWREDASNASDAYLRNQLRHHLLPTWEKIRPNIAEQIHQSIQRLSWAEEALAIQVEDFMEKHFAFDGDEIKIPIASIKTLRPMEYYLHALFSPYGFNHLSDLMDLLSAQSGKQLRSKSHRLVRDRDHLLLHPIPKNDQEQEEVVYWEATSDLQQPIKLQLVGETPQNKQTAILDASLLKYPLILRKYREGDYFYPVGMQGKKKLSKFFKDQKYSLLEKEQQWLLCSENDIVWVIGQRVDARYAAKEHSTTTIYIQCN